MRINYTGCAICDSTWGNVWADVEGERRFFCCEVCVTQFRALLDRVHTATGWKEVDALEITGDRRGRRVIAVRRDEAFRFFIVFNPQGEVRRFVPEGGTDQLRPATGPL